MSPASSTLRVGLVSPRPIPLSLVGHARRLLCAVAGDLGETETSRAGWFGLALTATAASRAAADVDVALAAELRGPATALGVDVAVTSGPLADDGAGLLVLDVDSTLITAEVIELLAAHADSREEVAAVTERAMRGELDFAASLRERVATLAGLDAGVVADVQAAAELSAGARELITEMHARGATVGLVSGGFAEIVEALAVDLGVDHVTANRLEVHGGRLTGRITGPVVDRAAKELHLRQWAADDGVPLARVVAIGDGANDLDMLAAAGLGIAYCAKPVVQEQAAAAVTFPRLDAVLGLLGG